MNDVDRELREMFERRGMDVPTPPAAPVIRRTRRRQVGMVVVSALAVVALVLVPLVGTRLARDADRGSRPAGQPVVLPNAPPGFHSAALPYASIAYPDGWYLLDTSPLVAMGPAQPYVVPNGTIVQLMNFDPDLPHSPRCMLDPDSLPPDGVLLSVGIVAPQEVSLEPPAGTWPVELQPFSSNMDPVCAGHPESAVWRAPSGIVYVATAGHGPQASEADVEAMHRAFETLVVPASGEPQMSRMAAIQSQGSPRVILGTDRVGSAVASIVAYIELNRSLNVGVSSSGSDGDCCLGGSIAPHSGSTDEPVASITSVTGDATLVWAVLSPEVATVEVRTSNGDTVPVSSIASLPPSVGFDDRVAWAVLPDVDRDATMVGYDAKGQPLGNPIYPTGPDEPIASGDVGGHAWTLTVTHDSAGVGMAFQWVEGSGGGGSIGPIGDRVFGGGIGGSSGTDRTADGSVLPRHLSGVVTADADAVDLELTQGGTIHADLYALPDGTLDRPAKAFLLFVPADTLVEAGDLVARDADGTELGRYYVDLSPVALFPKILEEPSDVVSAVKLLQLAGAAAGRYFETHDSSWAGFDPSTAGQIASGVTYNTAEASVTGEVSIRVASPTRLVLATRTPGGGVYAACMQDGGVYLYGRTDVSDPRDCTNGWLNDPSG